MLPLRAVLLLALAALGELAHFVWRRSPVKERVDHLVDACAVLLSGFCCHPLLLVLEVEAWLVRATGPSRHGCAQSRQVGRSGAIHVFGRQKPVQQPASCFEPAFESIFFVRLI